VPGRPIGPWSRRTGAPQASATGRDRSPPVHGGYTRSRQVEDCNGHQRSPRELRNRRSDRQRSRHQAPLQATGQSSSLPPLPTGLLLAAVREEGRLADPSDLLDGAAHGGLLDDDGAPDPEKVKAAISELLARRRHYAKRIGGDVGQGARPGQAEQGAMGIIQSRTRQIRCYWYRRIIESGMTKS
jgi:hypothetical protein